MVMMMMIMAIILALMYLSDCQPVGRSVRVLCVDLCVSVSVCVFESV